MSMVSKATDCLVSAVEQQLSGQIHVFDQQERIGEVVLDGGRVAWARCETQDENLVELLWRLGRVTRSQMVQVQQIFQQHGGTKRLDTIMEETGFMSRPVLRRCLLLHTRNAIEAMLSHGEATAELRARGVSQANGRILFGPLEVLPEGLVASLELPDELDDGDEWIKSWYTLNRDNLVLGELAKLQGYLASAVISYDGDIVAAHANSEEVDLASLAVYVAAMMEAGSRAVLPTPLRRQKHLTLACEEGWLGARWLDENRYYLLAALTDRSGDPGQTRTAMTQAAPGLYDWLMPDNT